MIFTDGSVQRRIKSGWDYSVRENGETVVEGSGTVDITTSSMEVKAITEALRYLQINHLKREIIVGFSPEMEPPATSRHFERH